MHIYLFPLSASSGWCIISTAGLNGIVCFLTLTMTKIWQKQFPSSSVLSPQTVKAQAAGPSKISVNIYQSTWRHTPEFFSVHPHFIFFSWHDITSTSVTLLRLLLFLVYVCVLRYWRKWTTYEISLLQINTFLDAFTKLRKAITSFVMSVCPSIRPHGTTRLPLDEFSWNLLFESFSKICPENSIFLEM